MIDTIVFDLDGTLLNTLDDLMDSANFALTKMGFKARSFGEVRAFVGNGVRTLIERALPADCGKETADKCLKLFSAHYDTNMNNKTHPYDGVFELLSAVKAAGYKTAIVSNKYDSAVKELADGLFKGFIDIAIGESETIKKKPAPDGVYAALEFLQSYKQNAVYIGDSDVDVSTAKNSGLKMIGVTWGFRDRQLLESMGADIIVDKPAEILSALKNLDV